MTYQEMCEFQTLYEAYLEARKGKRSKPGTAQYEANALICTDKLSYVLNQKTYKPSGFEVFYVYEPKKRLVQAPAFVDKVVLHALTDNVLYDTICTGFSSPTSSGPITVAPPSAWTSLAEMAAEWMAGMTRTLAGLVRRLKA